MQGDLVLAQFVIGNVMRVELSPDGRSVLAVLTIDDGFSQPLDVTVGPDGTIYVAEYGADQVAFLAPLSKAVGGLAEPPEVLRPGGRAHWGMIAAMALAAAAAVAALGVATRR